MTQVCFVTNCQFFTFRSSPQFVRLFQAQASCSIRNTSWTPWRASVTTSPTLNHERPQGLDANNRPCFCCASICASFAESGQLFGTQHVLDAMTRICDRLVQRYHWFVLMQDSTYIRVSTLNHVLNRLTPSTEIAICTYFRLPGSHKCNLKVEWSSFPGTLQVSKTLPFPYLLSQLCVLRLSGDPCLEATGVTWIALTGSSGIEFPVWKVQVWSTLRLLPPGWVEFLAWKAQENLRVEWSGTI